MGRATTIANSRIKPKIINENAEPRIQRNWKYSSVHAERERNALFANGLVANVNPKQTKTIRLEKP